MKLDVRAFVLEHHLVTLVEHHAYGEEYLMHIHELAVDLLVSAIVSVNTNFDISSGFDILPICYPTHGTRVPI